MIRTEAKFSPSQQGLFGQKRQVFANVFFLQIELELAQEIGEGNGSKSWGRRQRTNEEVASCQRKSHFLGYLTFVIINFLSCKTHHLRLIN